MSNTKVRVTIQTDKGKWKRRNDEYIDYKIQEDPANESSIGSIIVLADGQGGNINSNLCAKISAQSLIESYLEQDPSISIEDRMKISYQQVNELILDKAQVFHTPGMVCSLTAVIICDNTIWSAHVGTNRVFQITNKKELISLNQETDSMIGLTEKIVPVIVHKTITPDSHFLLVSDGITNQLSTELITQISSHSSPAQVVSQLIQQGNNAGGDDNMTACVINIGKFSKKPVATIEKVEPVKKRKEPKPARKNGATSFFVWLILILILALGIFLVRKFYSPLMNFLMPGISTNTIPQKPDQPPIVVPVPEASLLVTVEPRVVTVFLYEGDVPLNEKQVKPIFSSESTPAIIKGLKVGTYTLIIGTSGYEPYRNVIQIIDSDLSKERLVPVVMKPIVVEVAKTNPETPLEPPRETEAPKPPPISTVVMKDLTILSEPTNAKIYLNGTATGYMTPNVIKLKPGTYLVQLMKEGYESASRSVTFSSDSSRQSIFLTLKAVPVTVFVSSQPSGARIYMDNIYTGRTTPSSLSLPFGTHTIMVGKAGFEDQAINVTASPGVLLKPISFTLKLKPGTNSRTLFWVNLYEN